MSKITILVSLFLLILSTTTAFAQRGLYVGKSSNSLYKFTYTVDGAEIYGDEYTMGVKGQIGAVEKSTKDWTQIKFRGNFTAQDLVDSDVKLYDFRAVGNYIGSDGKSRKITLGLSFRGDRNSYEVSGSSGTFGNILGQLGAEVGNKININSKYKDVSYAQNPLTLAEGKKGLVIGRYGKQNNGLDQFTGKRTGNILNLTFNVPGQPAHSTAELTICPGGATIAGHLRDIVTKQVTWEIIWTKRPVGHKFNVLSPHHADCRRRDNSDFGYPF